MPTTLTEFQHLLVLWNQALAKLDKPLWKWGNTQVDSLDEKALKKVLARHPFKIDKAFRKRFHNVATAMCRVYLEGNLDYCKRIRALLGKYEGVLGNFCLPDSKKLRSVKDANHFRLALAIMSMRDQGMDMRDELLTLAELVREAKTAKIKVAPYLQEAAKFSSTVDKYGMGSMRLAIRSMTGKRVKELLE